MKLFASTPMNKWGCAVVGLMILANTILASNHVSQTSDQIRITALEYEVSQLQKKQKGQDRFMDLAMKMIDPQGYQEWKTSQAPN